MPENHEIRENLNSHIAVFAMVATLVFLIVCIFGEGMGGSLGSNPQCYKYLGCTNGFGGYDALEHFLFGMAASWMLVWIFQKFPQHSLLHIKYWKNILIIVALVMFASVIWEFIEYTHDIFRVDILHQTLIDWKLHINLLNQPTNIDTMGDLFFALFGSMLALFLQKYSNIIKIRKSPFSVFLFSFISDFFPII